MQETHHGCNNSTVADVQTKIRTHKEQHMSTTLTTLIASYGYIIVAVCIMLESAGLPLSGETALLLAAAAAGAGQLSICLVIAVAAIAAIVGDAGGYWLGREGGRPLLERYGRWLRLDAQKLDYIE